MITEVQQIEMKENISYNSFLYNKRKENSFSRIKFAKILHINYFKYVMIENGYLKPSKLDIKNISEYFGLDFNYYLEDSRGYPSEIPEKSPNAIVSFIYKILGSKALKIVLTVLSVLFATLAITGLVCGSKVDENQEKFYGPTVLALRDNVHDNGTTNFSLLDDFTYPQVSEVYKDEVEHTEKMIQIRTTNDQTSFDLDFIEIYWSDTVRFYFEFEQYDGLSYGYNYDAYRYDNGASYIGSLMNFGKTVIIDDKEMDEDTVLQIKNIFENNNFSEDFEGLIKRELDTELDFESDIASPLYNGEYITSTLNLTFALVHIGSIVFLALSVFGLSYAMIYGYKNKEINVFRHGDDLLLAKVERKPMKRDFKFTPFLPETFMEILGIVFVAIGSYRVVLLSSLLGNFSTENLNIANGNLLTLQMLGMFLLYFIDFDLFMDDKRVLRNIIMYALLFIVIYYIEAGLLSSLSSTESAISIAVNYLMIPNPFGSVGCYFGIMAFLYFTPKFIKTKKSLIIYRCCAILPIFYLIVSFLLFNGDVFFGMDVSNYWFRYFFNSERAAFSLLAVSYLVGLYFLRLFFKIKYGEEGGTRFINGNRFIFYKNILVSLIVIIVWAIDLFFIGNARANKMGIGVNGLIIILVPFLLFYHPHKGPRNIAVDWLTQFLYFLSMGYAYVLAVFVGIISLMV